MLLEGGGETSERHIDPCFSDRNPSSLFCKMQVSIEAGHGLGAGPMSRIHASEPFNNKNERVRDASKL